MIVYSLVAHPTYIVSRKNKPVVYYYGIRSHSQISKCKIVVFSMVQIRRRLIMRDTVLSITRVVPVLQNVLNFFGRRVVLKTRHCLAAVLATRQQIAPVESAAVETMGRKTMKYLSDCRTVSYDDGVRNCCNCTAGGQAAEYGLTSSCFLCDIAPRNHSQRTNICAIMFQCR